MPSPISMSDFEAEQVDMMINVISACMSLCGGAIMPSRLAKMTVRELLEVCTKNKIQLGVKSDGGQFFLHG